LIQTVEPAYESATVNTLLELEFQLWSTFLQHKRSILDQVGLGWRFPNANKLLHDSMAKLGEDNTSCSITTAYWKL